MKKTLKNRILVGINTIVGIIAVLAMCALDMDSDVPFYVFCGCLAWGSLFAYVNREVVC